MRMRRKEGRRALRCFRKAGGEHRGVPVLFVVPFHSAFHSPPHPWMAPALPRARSHPRAAQGQGKAEQEESTARDTDYGL